MTVGLDRLYYAPITEAADGQETYATPVWAAKAITAELSIELAEAILYADDGAAYVARDFRQGSISLGIDDLGRELAAALTGATIDSNGVLVSQSENVAPLVAIGFRAARPDGKYRYFWLYRVKFGFPSLDLETKGENIVFQTPTIEGIIMRRTRVDAFDKHPWKAEVTEGDSSVPPATITGWYTQVYEPVAPTP